MRSGPSQHLGQKQSFTAVQPCHVQRCVGQGAGSGQDQPRLRDSCRVSAAERAGGEGASCPTGEAFPGTGPSAHPQTRCQGEGHHEQARHLASLLQPGRTSHLLGPMLPGAPEHVGAHPVCPPPQGEGRSGTWWCGRRGNLLWPWCGQCWGGEGPSGELGYQQEWCGSSG